MITLFIDTSSVDVSIAVLKDEQIVSSIVKTIPNQHSVYTVDFIDKCFKKANITPNEVERIMVVNGPGSFTGVRIGVTIAKVYSYLKNIPIILVSSLKMLALSAEDSSYYLALLDARHDNYYLGLYDDNYQEVIEERFANKKDVLELIDKYHPIIVCNETINLDDRKVVKQDLDIVKVVSYYQNVEGVNPHFAVPNYLKLPQAMEK